MNKSKIYVASSWDNQYHDTIVNVLMALGHDVFDYRRPTTNKKGFNWNQSMDAKTLTVDEYIKSLNSPKSSKAYTYDIKAMHWADTCVLIMPAGNSNHIIAGWMKGQAKKVYIIQFTITGFELMHLLFDGIITTVDDISNVFKID